MDEIDLEARRYREIVDKFGWEGLCCNCDRTFGEHRGIKCPTGMNKFQHVSELSQDPNRSFMLKKLYKQYVKR